MNKSNKLAIPSFKDEKEERIFWKKMMLLITLIYQKLSR